MLSEVRDVLHKGSITSLSRTYGACGRVCVCVCAWACHTFCPLCLCSAQGVLPNPLLSPWHAQQQGLIRTSMPQRRHSELLTFFADASLTFYNKMHMCSNKFNQIFSQLHIYCVCEGCVSQLQANFAQTRLYRRLHYIKTGKNYAQTKE